MIERKVVSAQRRMERLTVGISLIDRMRAAWIRDQTKVEDILMSVEEKTDGHKK